MDSRMLMGKAYWLTQKLLGPLGPVFKNAVSKQRYRRRSVRKLEIGPGGRRLEGFEGLSVNNAWNVDYVWDAAKHLPFADNTFQLIYASHVLEHLPWYSTVETLKEWRRVLAPSGGLEAWVPDAFKICQAFIQGEKDGDQTFLEDGWLKFNDEADVCKWAGSRIFSYGDGSGNRAGSNWHHALFSPRYLVHCFEQAGFVDVRVMSPEDVRGYDHGWINLGVCGRNPG